MSTTDTEHRTCVCPAEPEVHCHACTKHERDERLRGIQERAQAATEGPWETYQVPATRKHAAFMAVEVGDIEVKVARFEGGFFDAAFIAAARTDVPWLLAEVARLDAVVTAVREVHVARPNSMSALHPKPLCSCDDEYPCATVRALDGGAS